MPMAQSQSHKISVTTAIIVGMNAMIGAGIFSAPSTLATTNGFVAICTYIFVIAAVWALALSISRLAYLYPQAGSFYTYAFQWGGQPAGICAISLYMLGLFIAMGLLTNIASTYLYGFFPYGSPSYIAYGLLALLAGLNIAGAELSELGQTLLIISTVFPIIATTVICFSQASLSNIHIPDTIAISDILKATKSVIFTFFGFESAASLYNVVKNPEKNVPKALSSSIIIVGILYLAFITSILLATPASLLTTQNVLLTDILQTIFPDKYYLIQMVYISLLSAIIGTLHAMLWSASALLRSTLPRIKRSWNISSLSSTTFVAATIAGAYTAIYDLDTYFSLTVVGIVSAYSLSMLTLLFIPREWKNGHNIITVAGLTAATSMMYFAIQYLVTGAA